MSAFECGACAGTGDSTGTDWCDECNGTGLLEIVHGSIVPFDVTAVEPEVDDGESIPEDPDTSRDWDIADAQEAL